MSDNLELYYNPEDDLLEIYLGKPKPSVFEEIEDDMFEGHDRATNQITGYQIFNFRKRGGIQAVKKFKIALPANVIIK